MEPYIASKNSHHQETKEDLKTHGRLSPWEKRKEHLISTDIMARTDLTQCSEYEAHVGCRHYSRKALGSQFHFTQGNYYFETFSSQAFPTLHGVGRNNKLDKPYLHPGKKPFQRKFCSSPLQPNLTGFPTLEL